jgi:alkyldihydroxyacetonephosphate synthase
MYDEVRRSVLHHAIVMAHFSHAYRDGCSIYFTFAGACDSPAESKRVYARVWHDALNAVVRSGGTISHHHGVGILKRDFMAREHAQGDRVFWALKAHFDPRGIMNPGKLFPDREEEDGDQKRGLEA